MQKYKGQMLLLVVSVVITLQARADELDDAAAKVASYYDGAARLMYAVAGIMGIIGAIKIYGKFTRGDDDVYKALGNWVGGCIFVVIAAITLQKFFA